MRLAELLEELPRIADQQVRLPSREATALIEV
jgi:hypothetical protein